MSTISYGNSGGWFEPRTVTGENTRRIIFTGWFAATLMLTGSTGEHPAFGSIASTGGRASSVEFCKPTSRADGRTALEDLVRIRDVLSPAVSDLAATIGVTRQSIYNWLNGDTIANENASKLRELALAADLLVQEGIEINSRLLKRKFADGKTLLQVAQSGGSVIGAASTLSHIIRVEATQRERLNARFATRQSRNATSDFDLPASNDLG